MYAVIKKAKKDLTAKYLLPSQNEAVELKALDDSEIVLQEWNKEMAGADVYNEIMAAGGKFFDSPEDVQEYVKSECKTIDAMPIDSIEIKEGEITVTAIIEPTKEFDLTEIKK